MSLQKSHQIKPQLILSKKLDSLRSFRQFSVKNYKSLSKLKLVKQLTDPRNHKLHKISIKSLKHLDFSSFNVQNLSPAQFKLFLKRFSKIQQFSGDQSFVPAFIIFKSIKDLYLKALLNSLPRQFLSLLPFSKIRTLHFHHVASYHSNPDMHLDFSPIKHLPPTLENLTLLLSGHPASPVVSFKAPFTVKHLSNLQKLELEIPVASENFKDLIKTIQEPLNLRSLRFNIVQERKEEFAEEDEIGEFLRKCCNLEELNIHCNTSWMIDFYSETENMKLKKLGIVQFVDKGNVMEKLGKLLQHQQNNLKSLSLNLMVNSDESSFSVKLWFDTLFARLKLLKNLKRLELRLIHFSHSQSQNITSALAKVIHQLDGLEEIDIKEITADYNNNHGMFEALEKHSKTLKSLKIDLQSCNCLEKFMHTLKKLSSLQHLTLQSLQVEDLKFYLDLRDIVCEKNRALNSLEIIGVRRPDGAENIVTMLKDIINKPTMNEFCYLEGMRFGTQAEFGKLEVLSLPNVLNQVHRFNSLMFLYEACKPHFVYWELDKYKWT